MTDANGLRRLALATKRCSEHFHRVRVADASEVAPELGADTTLIRVLDDVTKRSIANDASALASELKLVARIIDGPR